MAPGRIDFGVGTGFSARRAMGLGAMKLADMEEYIRVVYGLLAGETLETKVEGKRSKIRFLNPEFGLINTHGPDPAARLGLWPELAGADREAQRRAGSASSPTCPARWPRWRACSRAGARPAAAPATSTPPPGRAAACWRTGEPADSPRAMAQAGPRAAVLLHRAADVDMQGWQNTSPVPPTVHASRSTATSRWRAASSRRTRAI